MYEYRETGLDFIICEDFNLRDKYLVPGITYSDALKIKQLINVHARNESVLDLIFVNNESKVISACARNVFLLDHLLIECTYSYIEPKPIYITKTCRNYSNKNIIRFIYDIDLWLSTLPKQFEEFVSVFVQKANACFHWKTIRYKQKAIPTYLTSRTKQVLAKRKKIYLKSLAQPSLYLKRRLKLVQKQAKRLIIADKKIK